MSFLIKTSESNKIKLSLIKSKHLSTDIQCLALIYRPFASFASPPLFGNYSNHFSKLIIYPLVLSNILILLCLYVNGSLSLLSKI